MKKNNQKGYFGIGILRPKTGMNIGTLWRSAYQLGASFIFIIGKRYKKQCSDTLKTWQHIPLFQFKNYKTFKNSTLYNCRKVFIEFTDKSKDLVKFHHPKRCVYLLGAEDFGFTEEVKKDFRGSSVVEIPAIRTQSYNVAMAGTIVMYDRLFKDR